MSLITLLVVSDRHNLVTIIRQQLPPSWVILPPSKGAVITITKLEQNENSLSPIVKWSIMINSESKCSLAYRGTDINYDPGPIVSADDITHLLKKINECKICTGNSGVKYKALIDHKGVFLSKSGKTLLYYS